MCVCDEDGDGGYNDMWWWMVWRWLTYDDGCDIGLICFFIIVVI